MDMEPEEVEIWFGRIGSMRNQGRREEGRRGWTWWWRRRRVRVRAVVVGWFCGESQLRRDKVAVVGLVTWRGSTKILK